MDKKTRCPNGTRKNKKTGKCEPIINSKKGTKKKHQLVKKNALLKNLFTILSQKDVLWILLQIEKKLNN